MCGIWILFKQSPNLNNNILKSINSIKNRGPDHSTILLNNNYISCFHRLAINDLTILGNQPFIHTTDLYEYSLYINGEIYNHKTLENEYNIKVESNSDCHFIIYLFIILNENFKYLNQLLRGEYSLVIIKKEKYTENIFYFVSTDPLSVRPLFYYSDNSKKELFISSLLSGISTNSSEIKRLNQGSIITGKINYNNNVWEQEFSSYLKSNLQLYDKNLNINYFYSQIVNNLTDAVIIRLESDRPLGCLLSGGLDSSIVAYIASAELKKKGKKLKTFSIGMKGGTDLEYAKLVADHIDSDHTEFLYTVEEGLSVIDEVIKATETYDITTIRASIPQFILAKKISENTNIKVLLNGDGADECQMGYIYFYNSKSLIDAKLERDNLLNQIHYFDGLRVDRTLSYHGLEARVPYLDQYFVELYKKIPPELLIPTKNKMEKYMLRKAFENNNKNCLPAEILWRKKEAFSDGVSSKEDSWFLILKNYFEEKLSDKVILEMDGLKPMSKEAYYYRLKFNELYNNNHKIIPRYWLPNWTDNNDPSARTLNCY